MSCKECDCVLGFRTQGDTLQGVATELGCVLNTGCYRFVFNSSTQGVAASVQLHYRQVVLYVCECMVDRVLFLAVGLLLWGARRLGVREDP